MVRLGGRIKSRAKKWDRFAQWAPGAAMLALALIATVLAAAVLTERSAVYDAQPAQGPAQTTIVDTDRDTDLQLYDAIAERVAGGENYYQVAVEEQRARDFPVRPSLAVRLPTLAYIYAALGQWGMIALGAALAIGVLASWHFRLRDVPGSQERLRIILLLLVIGAATGFKPQYLALHEVWAGMLIALSIGLYRPHAWFWTLLVAALALAIRELALPFVLLMGSLAFVRGRKPEAIAWLALAVLFVASLLFHLTLVNEVTSAADPASPSWLALRGVGGWTSNIALSSPLHLLPGWLAAPLALLPLVGWAGWKTQIGTTGFLLCLGYGVLFMIAGRDNNFYWALLVMPVWFVGFAFVPRALASLWNSARGH